MLPVSDAYRSLVYSTTHARQFIPRVIMKMLDMSAYADYTYSASSEAYYSRLDQLNDDIHIGDSYYRTLEHNNFALDGLAQLLPDDVLPSGQLGWISGNLSDANGEFEDEWILCEYAAPITTPGKTIFFDENVSAHPVDIDLYYYHDDTLLATEQLRGIDDYFVSTYVGCTGYNKVLIKILKMSQPFSRVRILEDVPGLAINYIENDVISMTFVRSADIFMEELVSGELDLTVKNEDKVLDILNDAGKEQYLRKRQPMEVHLTMVFPNGAKEDVFLGILYLHSWGTNSSTLSATFTARDSLDKLTGEYYKGTYSSVIRSYYSLAEEVLQDAGITNYAIDPVLLNFYTHGILPVVSHKEALRLIAQATCSVVLPMRDGGVQIRYVGVPESWPQQVDSIDFSVLFDEPEVILREPIRKVSVHKHTYAVAAATSEVYKGTHTINGTETVTIKLNRMTHNCTATVSQGATLDTADFYARVAKLTITTEEEMDVTITITGYAIEDNVSEVSIDGLVDADFIPDATEISIDNPLITVAGVANHVMEYTAFWKKRRYQYDIAWRGNPAVELLDPVQIHDVFNKNNVAILTEQKLSIADGVLSATSKAHY